jgi:branched-chain amino acid transport system permease protein
MDSLGGYNGMPGITAPALGPINLLDQRTFWYFTLVCVCLGLAAFWQIGRSPFGHMLAAIRENPVRAAYLGINVRAYRAVAFTLAGCGAGLAGGLSAYANQIVTPSALYWTQSATPIIMLLLGGRFRFWGPAIGAVIMTWLIQDLSDITPAYIFYVGVILLLVLTVLPRGIVSLPAVLRDAWRGLGRLRATGAKGGGG